MARLFFDADADIDILSGRTIGVFGFGNQGRSQALNLRDSGAKVIVGSPHDASWSTARQDGFDVYSYREASERSDILLLLVPDEAMPAIYADSIEPGLRAGKTLSFASGYCVTFRKLKLPQDIDVVLVAPRMLGIGVRDTYLRGDGFPSLVGVGQDASGQALNVALAIAKGIGSTRMGAVMSSFEEETVVDLFTEQTSPLYALRAMFESLVEAGCDPDVVILELYGSGELTEEYGAARDMGLWSQLRLHSRTSQYGQQVTTLRNLDLEAAKRQYRETIRHIKSGEFAAEWDEDQKAGFPTLIDTTQRNLKHPLQTAENRLYKLLGRRDRDVDEPDWLRWAPTVDT